MALAIAIIGFLGTAAGIWFWWLKRRAAAADDPKTQNAKRHAQAEADVAKHESIAATVHGLDDLDALDRLSKRPGNPK